MPLSPAQLTTLKAHIDASADLNAQPDNSDGNAEVARLLNLTASPDYWAWRTSVPKNEYTQSTSADGTVFAWTGAGFITRSQGERDAWVQLFNASGAVNPSLANVRTAFADIFSGATAPAPANRAHLSAVSRRKVTRAERLFVAATVGGPAQTGARGATTNPDTLGFEGAVTASDVDSARNLP
jgi:hypothetical protein